MGCEDSVCYPWWSWINSPLALIPFYFNVVWPAPLRMPGDVFFFLFQTAIKTVNSITLGSHLQSLRSWSHRQCCWQTSGPSQSTETLWNLKRGAAFLVIFQQKDFPPQVADLGIWDICNDREACVCLCNKRNALNIPTCNLCGERIGEMKEAKWAFPSGLQTVIVSWNLGLCCLCVL